MGCIWGAYRFNSSFNWIFMAQENTWTAAESQIENLHDFPSLGLIYKATNMTYALHYCLFLSFYQLCVHPSIYSSLAIIRNEWRRDIGGIAITKRRVFFRIDSGQIHGSGKALFLSPRTKRKKFKSSGEKETRTIIISVALSTNGSLGIKMSYGRSVVWGTHPIQSCLYRWTDAPWEKVKLRCIFK